MGDHLTLKTTNMKKMTLLITGWLQYCLAIAQIYTSARSSTCCNVFT